jgi:hypothetical protein
VALHPPPGPTGHPLSPPSQASSLICSPPCSQPSAWASSLAFPLPPSRRSTPPYSPEGPYTLLLSYQDLVLGQSGLCSYPGLEFCVWIKNFLKRLTVSQAQRLRTPLGFCNQSPSIDISSPLSKGPMIPLQGPSPPQIALSLTPSNS